MKFAVIKNEGAAVITEGGCLLLNDLGFPGTLEDLITTGYDAVEIIKKNILTSAKRYLPFESIGFNAPLRRPGKIVAIGLNYVDHASESKMQMPLHPLIFTKFNSSITGPYDPIIIPSSITNKVDYEVELAIIIGRQAKNISKGEALKYVFGYTVINDVSARDIQFADGQWVRGKSLDTFCPMGPYLVTSDEIADPQDLQLSCAVNGEVLQNSSTKDMIFGVADLISILSKSFTFEPGDIISTGTPSGVGFARKPPVFLKQDDIMISEIQNIGKLINRIEVI